MRFDSDPGVLCLLSGSVNWLTENERRIDVQKKVGVQLPEKEERMLGKQ